MQYTALVFPLCPTLQLPRLGVHISDQSRIQEKKLI